MRFLVPFIIIFRNLSSTRKYQIFFLLCLFFITSLIECLSVIIVPPYLASFTQKEILFDNVLINNFFQLFFNINNKNSIFLTFTLLFIFIIILSALLRALSIFSNSMLSAWIGNDISSLIYNISLRKPFIKHLETNSSEVILLCTTQVGHSVASIRGLLMIVGNVLQILLVFIAFLFIDWKIALISALVFCLTYFLISSRTKDYLTSRSIIITESNNRLIQTLQEGIGNIRDVIMNDNYNTYVQSFKSFDRRYRTLESKLSIVGVLPKFIIEPTAFILLAFLAFYSIVVIESSEKSILPVLGSLAFGAQKILPALQIVFAQWAFVKAVSSPLDDVSNALNNRVKESETTFKVIPKIKIKDEVKFENFSFKYSEKNRYILRDFNLSIKAGEKLAIIGPTGSGKSTILDLMMGLLEPKSGCIFVDNNPIKINSSSYNLASWRLSIAHVPQFIYLSDSTILENIAFGEHLSNIDHIKAKRAAQLSMISSFIDKLPDKYMTTVGERGASLSGGQRQRIGIARALYKNASILFLDEATNSLDQSTEGSIVDCLNSLDDSITIVMVTHRLSSLKYFDRVIKIIDGEIIFEGKPSDLI